MWENCVLGRGGGGGGSIKRGWYATDISLVTGRAELYIYLYTVLLEGLSTE